MEQLIQQMINYRCPRWDELPQLDLYIDQVVLYLQDRLALFDTQNNPVTPAMINNYVKQKVVVPPIKKKYGREHLAHFFVIFIMKRLMNITQLGAIIDEMKSLYSVEEGYHLFCEELEYAIKSTFDPKQFPLRPFQPEEKRELSVLQSMSTTFAHMILTDQLISLPKE